jgi:hypothetical protein
MTINLETVLPYIIPIIINIVILSPMLWIAGRSLVGKEKAKFTDAVMIVALGTVIGWVVEALFVGLLALAIMLVIWLGLIKHFFDCGWLMALAISIISVIIFVVIVYILAIIGFVVWSLI